MKAQLASLVFVPCSLLAQGVDAMFVLEMTPGTEQAIGLLRPRDLKESDRAGVIGFFRSAQVLQRLTENRDILDKVLRRAGTRIAVGLGGARPGDFIAPVNLGAAIKLACREFGVQEPTGRQRAVIVLFVNDDPSLGSNSESTRNALRDVGARLFAVAIQKAPAPDGARGWRGLSDYPFPAITAQILSELARDSGGRVFRRNWDLKEILAEARKPPGEQH